MQPAKFFSISEAAQLLGISAKTLRRWDKSGKVKINRTPNGDRIFTLDEIENLRKKVSPFVVQNSVSIDQPNLPSPHLSGPKIGNKRFVVAGIMVLLIALVYSNFILAFNLKQNNKVLGVETFAAPASVAFDAIVEEVSPVLSPVFKFISGLGSFFQQRIGLFLLAFINSTGVQTTSSNTSFSLPEGIKVEGDNIFLGSSNLGTTTVNNDFQVIGSSTLQNVQVQGSLNVQGPTTIRQLTANSSTVSNSITTGNETIGGNLSLSSTSPIISIGNTGTLKITDGTNTLLTLSDGGTIGNLIVTGTIESSNISSGAKVSGTNTGDQTITLTGDVTGSGTGSFATTLTTSGVTAAVYGGSTSVPVLTVDSKGRITSATTASISSTPAWSSLSNPSANLSLSMAAYTTTFTWNAATGASTNLFNLTDTSSNTGTGYLANISTAASSSLKPFHVGTATIDAITVLANGNTGIGTSNPGAQLQVNTSGTGVIGEIIKAQTSQSADLLQIRSSLDAVLAKVDNLGNISGNTLTSTVATGTSPLTVTSTTLVSNLHVASADQPQPNLVLNSDFGRRNKWMTFMPETFTDTSGITSLVGGAPSVSANVLTQGTAGTAIKNDATRAVREGLSTWQDVRMSAQFTVAEIANNKEYMLFKWTDANNMVSCEWQNNFIAISKVVNGTKSYVGVTNTAAAITLNNKAWLEAEFQGSTVICKVYNSGTGYVAKSSATLVTTFTQTVSDTSVAAGYIAYGDSTTNASQWGGLSTGDGGVYVEGWGPESWTVQFLGTLGGQAIGFDESTDAGPIGKQWALRTYIPATSREIDVLSNTTYADTSVPLIPSTTYAISVYENTSGTSGSGLVQSYFYSRALGGGGDTSVSLSDAQETSWTRKTSTLTTGSTGRLAAVTIYFNIGRSVTGTGFVMLPQLEQGSIATPWRNAPADDGPITWEVWSGGINNLLANFSTTSLSYVEMDSRNYAANLFLPWDSTARAEVTTQIANSLTSQRVFVSHTIDGTLQSDASGFIGYHQASGTLITAASYTHAHNLAAGKHRIALVWKTDGGTMTGYPPSTSMVITASRGKYDLAEEYSVADTTIEGGDVVRLANNTNNPISNTLIEKTDKGYDSSILGVISTAPGITLSSSVELNSYQQKPTLRPVALQGRVPVKVTNESGVIRRGDILTSSQTKPGYAMKATKAGRSIGVAMEDFMSSSTSEVQLGKIMTFVNLSFYDPQVYLTDSGELSIVKQTQTPNPVTLVDNGTGTVQIRDNKPQYQVQSTQTKEVIERTGGYNNLFVANLKVGSLDVSNISSQQIKDLELRIKNLEIGTTSAVLSASISGLLNDKQASNSGILSSLTVQGRTLLNDLGITGKVTAGLISIDGLGGSINSLTDLRFKVPGGEVSLDKDGNLTTKKINISTADAQSASLGKATLPIGQTSVIIQTTSVGTDSAVFVTLETSNDTPLAVTSRIAGQSFTVELSKPTPRDLRFNWWIVN